MARGREAIEAFTNYREIRQTQPAEAALLLKEFRENEQYMGYGYLQSADQLVPPVPLVYWAFRVMVGAGSALLLLLVVLWWMARKGKLERYPILLHAGLWSIVLVYLAEQGGWIVAEVGRQPWAIQDLLPVGAAASSLPTANVCTTFFLFLALFTLLLVAEVRIMCRAIAKHKAKE